MRVASIRRVARTFADCRAFGSVGTAPPGKTPLPTSVPEIAVKEDLPEVSVLLVGNAVCGAYP